MLTQHFLYQGNFPNALKCALRLSEFELELPARKIYSLLALASYYNKSYKFCAKALIKLQGISDLQIEEKERYEEIAVQIFSKYTDYILSHYS